MTDQKTLVDNILAGDQNAFKTLIGQYQRLVTHFVFRMVPSQADREDICQEVFVKIYQHLDRFRFDSSLSTWIGRIAYNTCLNHLEKKKLLIRKAYEALPAGGVLIAIENVIDNERRQNAFGLMMSLNMLIELGDGFDYTAAQFDGWAKEAGFQKTTLLPLTGPTSAAIAWK